MDDKIVMKNFRDEITGEEFYFPEFRTIITNNGNVYKDKYGKEILNPSTKEKLKYIERNIDETIKMPMLAKFNPQTREGQDHIRSHFGGRANKFDTKGAGGMEKKEKEKAFQNQIIERAKEGRL